MKNADLNPNLSGYVRRLGLYAALIAVSALLLAGCGGEAGAENDGTPLAAKWPTPVPTEAVPSPTPFPKVTIEPEPTTTPNNPAGGSSVAATAANPTEEAKRMAKVVAPSLAVRDGPGVDNRAIGSLSEGDVVPVLDVDAETGWLKVELPSGDTGWISGKDEYAQVVGEDGGEGETPAAESGAAGSVVGTKVRVLADSLAVYEGPDTSYAQSGTLSKGDEVIVIEVDWVRRIALVSLPDGGQGWVTASPQDIQVIGRVESEPAAPSGGEAAGATPVSTAVPAAPATVSSETAREGGLQVEVLAETVEAHAAADLSSQVVGTASGGDVLPVINLRGSYVQVLLSGGSAGWIYTGGDSVRLATSIEHIIEQETDAVANALEVSTYGPRDKSGKIVFQTVSGGAIYVVNADGSGLHFLTDGMDPALSPDGSKVAFSRWEGDDGLYVINVDGSGESNPWNANKLKSPTWSPDGKEIAFTLQAGGHTDIVQVCQSYDHLGDDINFWKAYDMNFGQEGFCYKLPPDPHWRIGKINLATGYYEDVPSDIRSYAPSWNPSNGDQLLYVGDTSLVMRDIANQNSWGVGGDAGDRGPVVSPDGSRIATTYWQDGHWEIHVMNLDGSGRVRLTDTPLSAVVAQGVDARPWNNASPAWSPDGSEIAFVTDRSGKWEIWVMNADGSDQRPMFAPGLPDLQYNGVDDRMLSWGR